jgi:hypothetical protein
LKGIRLIMENPDRQQPVPCISGRGCTSGDFCEYENSSWLGRRTSFHQLMNRE